MFPWIEVIKTKKKEGWREDSAKGNCNRKTCIRPIFSGSWFVYVDVGCMKQNNMADSECY